MSLYFEKHECYHPLCKDLAKSLCTECQPYTIWCDLHKSQHESSTNHKIFIPKYIILESVSKDDLIGSIAKCLEGLRNIQNQTIKFTSKIVSQIKSLSSRIIKETNSIAQIYQSIMKNCQELKVVDNETLIYFKDAFTHDLKIPLPNSTFDNFKVYFNALNEKLKIYKTNLNKILLEPSKNILQKLTNDLEIKQLLSINSKLSFKWKVNLTSVTAMSYVSNSLKNSFDSLDKKKLNFLRFKDKYLNLRINVGNMHYKCKICFQPVINQGFYISPCKGYLHVNCLHQVKFYSQSEATISIMFICGVCNSSHVCDSRTVYVCTSCNSTYTYWKDSLNCSICLQCLNYHYSNHENVSPFIIIAKNCVELISNFQYFCYYCNEFAELFMDQKCYTCYKCALNLARTINTNMSIRNSLYQRYSAIQEENSMPQSSSITRKGNSTPQSSSMIRKENSTPQPFSVIRKESPARQPPKKKNN